MYQRYCCKYSKYSKEDSIFFVKKILFKYTNSLEWTELYVNLLTQEYMRYILGVASNFENSTGLLKEEIIEKYGFKCENDCSGNGVCVRSN